MSFAVGMLVARTLRIFESLEPVLIFSGAGYHLTIVKQPGCDVGLMTEQIQRFISDSKVDQDHGAELSYVLPNEDVAKFEALFEFLEQNKEELKISSYGASQTTMDEVFLR